MEKTPGGWTVIDRDAGVLTYTYEFTKGGLSTTFVARMGDGKLLVVSPCTGLTDEAAKELEAFGEVGAVMANNGFHHLGVAAWRERYPNARFFAPAEAIKRIKKKNADAGDFEPLSALVGTTGDDVGIHDVDNTKCGESWVWARTANGSAWYVSDVLANIPGLPKPLIPKLLFKLTGSAPGYRVFNLALKFIVKDKKAVLRALLADMEKLPPTVVVPAHGPLLDQASVAADTREVLQAAL